jgi:hypothetical protein
LYNRKKMRYQRLNTISGWLVFAIALVVYMLTMERTASFWDCGEFISASYLLQVVHPPGAPFFLLLGNIFSQLAPGPDQVAFMVNMLSAVTSAFCVLFTFWTITHFAVKLAGNASAEPSRKNWLVIGSGAVGALALTFSDTFWFSAVEAEVYASSSFFTALTFWCILKWENSSGSPGANRWLLLISYLIGLAIGVHLLNLLVIPAIVYVYYFKNYSYTRKSFVLASLIGLGILGVIQVGIIPGLPTMAAKTDLFFVNSLGLGFGSGIAFFSGVLLLLLVLGIWYSAKNKKVWLHTGLMCFSFVLIGYSSYAMVIIRSLGDPPIDMNNPENAFALVNYLNREQYGDRPLLKGPYFNAPARAVEEGKKFYRKGKEKYELASIRPEYVWDEKYVTVFPRMGDMQKESSPDGYRYWADVSKDKVPSFSQNMAFFFKYQLGHMYWRYFLWNFAGRQNGLQGDGDPVNGNWISGLKPLDAFRLGPQSGLPSHFAADKARNTYFLLPLVLGLMGLIYQLSKRRNDFFVVMVLFLFTGILIAVYLNAPPYEPRERDYTLVGSFQIFCIWIGLGVLQLAEWLSRHLRKNAAFVAVLTGLVAVPVLMGFQNWDDHDRSKRTMVADYARNYLESCEPNAILFTNGDNDTYPLWYVQNVEGFRTDVRVVNLQLLNFDWYVRALTTKIYDSDPFTLSVPEEKYAEGLREHVSFYENPVLPISQNDYYPFREVLQFITNDVDPRTKREGFFGERINYLPTKNLTIPVDREKAMSSGAVPPSDQEYIVDQLRFTVPGSGLLKSDWVLLDLVLNNQFERPVCFASNSISANHLGLGDYFRLDGLVYRLVPVKKPEDPKVPINMNPDILYDRLINKFSMGGVKDPSVLLDEQTIRMCRTYRNYFGILAMKLALDGKKDSTLAVFEKCVKEIPGSVMPYDFAQFVLPLAQAAYEIKENEKGDALLREFVQEQEERARYFRQFTGKHRARVQHRLTESLNNLEQVAGLAGRYSRKEVQEETQIKISSLNH